MAGRQRTYDLEQSPKKKHRYTPEEESIFQALVSSSDISAASDQFINSRTGFAITAADLFWPDIVYDTVDGKQKIWLVFPPPPNGTEMGFLMGKREVKVHLTRQLFDQVDLESMVPVSRFRTHTSQPIKTSFTVTLPVKFVSLSRPSAPNLLS